MEGYSDDIKIAFDDFIKTRDEINELVKNYEKLLENNNYEESLKNADKLLSKLDGIESMSSFIRRVKEEDTGKENPHKKLVEYVSMEFKGLQSKINSATILNSATLEDIMKEKIENLEEMMNQYEFSKKKERLHFLTTSADEIDEEIKLYHEKVNRFLKALYRKDDKIHSYKNFTTVPAKTPPVQNMG